MMCPAPPRLVRGKSFADSIAQPDMMTPTRPPRQPGLRTSAANPLERLAQLVNANNRLLNDLSASRSRIVAALTYLDQPGCHSRVGSAHLERCRIRHAGILAQLRANRIEALSLLGE